MKSGISELTMAFVVDWFYDILSYLGASSVKPLMWDSQFSVLHGRFRGVRDTQRSHRAVRGHSAEAACSITKRAI